MPVRGDRGFPPRRELSGWLRVSFLPDLAASGCVGAGGLRVAPLCARVWSLWAVGSSSGDPGARKARIASTALMACGLSESLGFEMKSPVGESVEPSALVSVPKTFCACGRRLDA
ncbi:Tight junction protein ZO-2 [Cricetulus griseus]|uniref:Tight junction protein ZO-2 n=1 Tax=Cricetulus griseus TaxID=10029 RepID=G3INA1_CRIGR|nr:Tight junction protein ZO-2 [Cricetulus griseus]ERE80814.1 tight junction protein ZO-2 isoform 1 [Cricetulus griseus]